MKKFALFLAPLMAISFLTNCGGQSGPKQYTVTFDSNGGTPVASQTIEENKCATKPSDPTRAEDDQGIYTFNEWQLDGNKFDFANPINKDITLKADWNIAHKYAVTTGTCEHLSFTTLTGDDLSTIKAIEGQDFKFKMKSSGVGYLVPTSLEIKINDMPALTSDFYHITPKEDNSEAEVLIDGIKVIGNITISGDGIETNKYSYEISVYYGLDIAPTLPIGIRSKTEQNFTIKFTPKTKDSNNDTYAKPKAENILIEFDNVNGKKK